MLSTEIPPNGIVSDADFARIWFEEGCSPSLVAKALGMAQQNVFKRRDRMSARGVDLPTVARNPGYLRAAWTYPREVSHTLPTGGVVMVAGDLHMWPRARVAEPLIQSAFREVARYLKPDAIVLNGDLIDATRISRHPKVRGQNAPTVMEELTAASDYLASLPEAPFRAVTMSNHDVRVDNYLANMAPEMTDMAGRMTDRLPGWGMSYAVVVNEGVEIRHDMLGGQYAAYRNTHNSGVTMVTGHTHQLSVMPFHDRRGTRYGVECGMLADPEGPQFEYTWGRPTRWQAGFIVLTFDAAGLLLPPEKCEWLNGRAVFRGADVGTGKPRVRVRAAT